MPPFHLIGVAKEDWSPFSLRINSLYSTSFVKYGFSVKPFNKTIYEKLGLSMVLGGRWKLQRCHLCIIIAVIIFSLCLFPTFCHFKKVYMYHGIHTFLMQSMWSFFTGEISWFEKLSIDSNLTLFCPLLQLCSSESLYNIKFSATFYEHMYLTYRLRETIR